MEHHEIDHTLECVKEIQNRVIEGQGKHLNVFISKNIDKDVIINQFYKKFGEERLEVLGRYKGEDWRSQEYDEISSFFDRRNSSLKEGTIVLLVDFNAAERKRFGKYMKKNTKTTVITINTPALSEETDQSLKAMGIDTSCVNVKERARYTNDRVALALTCVEQQFLIYELDTIYDVRDIGIAKTKEQSKIKKQLKADLGLFNNQVKTLYTELKNPVMGFIDSKTPSMGLLSIEQAQKNCILLFEMVQFLQQILDSVGIDKNAVMEQFMQIQRIKAENEADLESEDEEVRKIARKKIVDAIAEGANRLTRNTITVAVYDEIEAEITETLSLNVWKKLSAESKRYLVSAIASYRVLEKYQAKNKKEKVDFSGVCILMAKAVEKEMFIRLFKNYKIYVEREKKQNYGAWPYGLKKWKDDKPVPQEDHDFTLGSIPFILGCNNGAKSWDRNLFKDYAREELYDYYYRIEENINLLNEMSLEIKRKYRNNAAHRDGLDYETATSCKDYIIYVEKALKQILGEMKY